MRSYPSGDVLYDDEDGDLSGGYVLVDGEAIVFAAPSDADGASHSVYACMYDESASMYLVPVTVVPSSSSQPGCTVSSLRAQSSDGRLLLTWRYTGEGGDSPSAEWTEVRPSAELLKGDVDFGILYGEEEGGDKTIRLRALVTNRGTSDLEVKYRIVTENGPLEYPVPAMAVRPGATAALDFDATAFSAEGAFNIWIMWADKAKDPGSPDYWSSISLGSQLSVGYTDLVTTAEHVSLGGVDYVLVSLANNGTRAASGTVWCGPGVLKAGGDGYASGFEFGTEKKLEPGDHLVFKVLAEPGILSKEGIMTVYASSDYEMPSLVGNNAAVVSVPGAVDIENSSSANGLVEDPVLERSSGTYIRGIGQVLGSAAADAEGEDVVADPYNEGGRILVSEGLTIGFRAGLGNVLLDLVLTGGSLEEPIGQFSAEELSQWTSGGSVVLDPLLTEGLVAGSYRAVLTVGNETACRDLVYDLTVLSGIKTARWYEDAEAASSGADPAHTIRYVEGYVPDKDMFEASPKDGLIATSWSVYDEGADGIVFLADYVGTREVVRILSKVGQPAVITSERYPETDAYITFANYEGRNIQNPEGSTFALGKDLVYGWMLCEYELDGEGRLLAPEDPVYYMGAYRGIPLSDYPDGDRVALVAVYKESLRCAVTLEAAPKEYGTVSASSATVAYGTEFSCDGSTLFIGGTAVEAVPNPGTASSAYQFDHWSASSGEVFGDMTLTAYFSVVPDDEIGGECGDDLIWTLSDEGLLRVTGSGGMWDWSKTTKVPWYEYKDRITSVSIEGATSVGKKAFYEYPSLASADLGSAETVGDFAFYSCKNLASITFGSVRSIGEKAFSYCKASELDIPETLKYVGPYAFYSCMSLTSLDIPGDDVVLEASAFSACKKMSTITFSGHGAVIGSNAFYKNNGVTSVDLSTVASVGTKAFPYCNGMESLVIPGNLASVGAYAFYQCANLRTLVVEEGVKTLSRSAFSGCKALESVSFPSTLKTVGENAFYGLRFVDEDGSPIEPTRDNLRGHSFSGSGGVLHMAEELSDGDEFEAGGLAYKVTSVAAREASLIGYSVSPAKLAVPDTVSHGGVSFRVTSIGAGAFKNCDTLTSVDLGLVIEVGDQAFYGCGSLSSIDLSAVETIGFKAFPNAALVESLTIPSSVSSIGGYAFFGLQSLTSLTILTDTDSIGGGAFSGCPSLNSFKGIHPGIVDGAMLVVDGKVVSSAAGPGISGVSIPDGVSAIEGGVFSGNSYLTRVIMPDTVTALGQYAFYNCHALSDVVMSSSLESGQQERLPWNFVLRLRRGNQARRRCSLAGRRAFRPRRRKAGAHGRSRRRRRLHAVRNQVHGDVLGSVHGLHHRILRAGGVLDRAR